MTHTARPLAIRALRAAVLYAAGVATAAAACVAGTLTGRRSQAAARLAQRLAAIACTDDPREAPPTEMDTEMAAKIAAEIAAAQARCRDGLARHRAAAHLPPTTPSSASAAGPADTACASATPQRRSTDRAACHGATSTRPTPAPRSSSRGDARRISGARIVTHQRPLSPADRARSRMLAPVLARIDTQQPPARRRRIAADAAFACAMGLAGAWLLAAALAPSTAADLRLDVPAVRIQPPATTPHGLPLRTAAIGAASSHAYTDPTPAADAAPTSR